MAWQSFPDLNRGFITDGEQGKIVIFDLKTLKVIGDVNAAKDADSILYDPSSTHVFSFNGDSQSSTVVDPATGKGCRNDRARRRARICGRGWARNDLRQPRGQE